MAAKIGVFIKNYLNTFSDTKLTKWNSTAVIDLTKWFWKYCLFL